MQAAKIKLVWHPTFLSDLPEARGPTAEAAAAAASPITTLPTAKIY